MSNTKRQILFWLLSLVVWYTLMGFVVMPRLIRWIVLWQAPKQIHREVALAKVRLNPYIFSASIEGLDIRERDGSRFVSCDEIYVNVDPLALLAHELVLSDVAVSNAYGHVQANHDGSFNFSDLLNQFSGGPPKPSPGTPMTLKIGQLRIMASSVVYDDLTRSSPFSTTVGPIDVTLHDFSTDPANRNPYGFTAETESGEKLAWRGFFSLGPLRSSGDFSITNVKLKKYAPYYNDFVNLTINDGTVDLRSSYEVEFTDHPTIAKVSKLAVNLHVLKIAGHGATNNLIEIPELGLGDVAVDAIGQTAQVGTLIVRGARFEVERQTNGVINLLNLLPESKATNTAAATASAASAPLPPWTATVHNINLQDFGIHVTGFLGEQNARWEALQIADIEAKANPLAVSVDTIAWHEPVLDVLITDDLKKLIAALPASPTNAPVKTQTPPAPLPPIKIRSIMIGNAAVNYTDQSLDPHAAIAMDKFDVAIDGLSTAPGSRADIHVNGRIDNLAPVELTGHINPLDIDAATDLQVSIKGIDLVPVGSYSGRYLGYLVRKGKVTVQMKYDINQRQLTAQNQVVVDQFTFGDPIDSPEALKLPVKLGVAILKDRNGKIVLDVPVAGRIDDPQFQYWGAVWHIVGNLFTKIFTAPFSMIGSMFGGGGEELSYCEFAPGSTGITADQTAKLDVIIKALTERPALNLEIAGSIDPVKDTEPLKIQKLDRQLLELRSKREPGATNALTVVERAAYLRQAYSDALPRIRELQAAAAATNPPPTEATTTFHSNVTNLEMPGTPTETPSKEFTRSRAKKVAAELTVDEMQRQYLDLIQLTDDDARPVVAARAAAVVAYFKSKGQIADDRLLVSDNPKAPVHKEGARAVFSLE